MRPQTYHNFQSQHYIGGSIPNKLINQKSQTKYQTEQNLQQQTRNSNQNTINASNRMQLYRELGMRRKKRKSNMFHQNMRTQTF